MYINTENILYIVIHIHKNPYLDQKQIKKLI